jgi:hypothetical protein
VKTRHMATVDAGASVDRLAAHVLGEAPVGAAKEADLELTMPAEVHKSRDRESRAG